MNETFDLAIDDIVWGAITILFVCLVMIIADFCILFIAIAATVLFGPQKYIISLENLMFIGSVIVGITYIIKSHFIKL